MFNCKGSSCVRSWAQTAKITLENIKNSPAGQNHSPYSHDLDSRITKII